MLSRFFLGTKSEPYGIRNRKLLPYRRVNPKSIPAYLPGRLKGLRRNRNCSTLSSFLFFAGRGSYLPNTADYYRRIDRCNRAGAYLDSEPSHINVGFPNRYACRSVAQTLLRYAYESGSNASYDPLNRPCAHGDKTMSGDCCRPIRNLHIHTVFLGFACTTERYQ